MVLSVQGYGTFATSHSRSTYVAAADDDDHAADYDAVASATLEASAISRNAHAINAVADDASAIFSPHADAYADAAATIGPPAFGVHRCDAAARLTHDATTNDSS